METLHRFLAALPDGVAVRLAQAVEYDWLTGGAGLPHDAILESLRPALRRASGMRRVPSALRWFCRPFEDLLVGARTGPKAKGRIARCSIRPVWRWLATILLCDETESYLSGMKEAATRGREDDAMVRAARFWPLAAQALARGLAEPEAARAVLGGDDIAADAKEMALLLSVAAEITALQARFPKPLPSLDEGSLRMLRDAYDRLIAAAPDAAPYIAVIAMNRLAKPWEALRLPLMVARQSDDTLISSTDMGLAGELLLAEMDAHALAIRTARPPRFDADDLARHVARFAQLSTGIAAEVEIRRGGRWSQRLLSDRAAVGDVMADHVRRGARDILAALPTIKSGAYAGGPRVPDLGRRFDSERAEGAVNAARLIAGCRASAAGACFGAALADADEETAIGLKSYTDELVRELRATEGERRGIAEQYFALAILLTGILFSTEEAAFLQRRGRAAVASASQAA
jgi:hypothetical protein